MSLTTISTLVMIMFIFWLVVHTLGELFLGNGWILVGVVLAVSLGIAGYFLWSERKWKQK